MTTKGRPPTGRRRADKVVNRRKRRARDAAAARRADAQADALLAEAEERAAQELGYRVTADTAAWFTESQLAGWEAAVGEHVTELLGPDRGSELDFLVAMLEDSVLSAVQETVDQSSPRPALDRVARIITVDEEEGGPSGGTPPGQAIAFTTLLDWLAQARDELADPGLADRAVGWVHDALGRECAADCDRLRGLLVSREATEEVVGEPAEALGDRLLPAMVWLAAGVLADRRGAAGSLHQVEPG